MASTPLAPEYLRAEVDRLAFGVRPAEVPVAPPLLMAVNTKTGPSGAPVVQGKREGIQPEDSEENSLELQAISEARQAGLEPTTLGLEGRCSIQLSYWRKTVFSATYLNACCPGSSVRSCYVGTCTPFSIGSTFATGFNRSTSSRS